MEFEGNCALVTGAASGMGLLLSQCYAREGGNVAMVDVNENALNECVEKINADGKGRAVGVVCDVRDYKQVCAAVEKTMEAFHRIDLLVNFAGGASTRIWKVAPGLEFPDVPIEIYDWGLDVNLRAQIYFAHAVMKQMREQKEGVIINIGSISGEEGAWRDMDYSAAKSGAMYGLTRSLALYGAKYGVRCCCVSPGPVLTRPAMSRMKTAMGRAAQPQGKALPAPGAPLRGVLQPPGRHPKSPLVPVRDDQSHVFGKRRPFQEIPLPPQPLFKLLLGEDVGVIKIYGGVKPCCDSSSLGRRPSRAATTASISR